MIERRTCLTLGTDADPCRSRKIRCVREPGSDTCKSCLSKSLPCTTAYVSLALSQACQWPPLPQNPSGTTPSAAAAPATTNKRPRRASSPEPEAERGRGTAGSDHLTALLVWLFGPDGAKSVVNDVVRHVARTLRLIWRPTLSRASPLSSDRRPKFTSRFYEPGGRTAGRHGRCARAGIRDQVLRSFAGQSRNQDLRRPAAARGAALRREALSLASRADVNLARTAGAGKAPSWEGASRCLLLEVLLAMHESFADTAVYREPEALYARIRGRGAARGRDGAGHKACTHPTAALLCLPAPLTRQRLHREPLRRNPQFLPNLAALR